MKIIYQKNKKFPGIQNNGQITDPRSKKKRWKGKRRKYIKKQQIWNQNLKTVPISMENKKKRTTHPEIWILENRNRGFASTYRNMHFFLFSSSFFFPPPPAPFFTGTRRMEIELCARRYWRIRQVYEQQWRNTKLEIGHWEPRRVHHKLVQFRYGDEISGEVVKPLNSKSIKVNRK